MLDAIIIVIAQYARDQSPNSVLPCGEPILESGVFEEYLSEQARVGAPFCCLPDNIAAVQHFPTNSGRGSYACSNQHAKLLIKCMLQDHKEIINNSKMVEIKRDT